MSTVATTELIPTLTLLLRTMVSSSCPKMQRKGPTSSPTERVKVQRIFDSLLFELHSWGVPISERICPEVGFVDRNDAYAVTYKLEGDRYKVNITNLIWKEYSNISEAVKNILAHECVHTVEGCFNHGALWKYWVNWLNAEHGFKINPRPFSEKPTNLY